MFLLIFFRNCVNKIKFKLSLKETKEKVFFIFLYEQKLFACLRHACGCYQLREF
jgi:hypothetical protein